MQTWSPYHPLNTGQSGQNSPWPSRLARAFSEEPSSVSDRLSREFEGRMSIGERSSMEEAQSTTSANTGMPHHVTTTIAEEEQEDMSEAEDKPGVDPSWAGAAAAAAAAAGTDWGEVSAARGGPGSAAGQGSEAGQSWNWPWLAGQLASEHGTIDPSALLDDESEGECPLRRLHLHRQSSQACTRNHMQV